MLPRKKALLIAGTALAVTSSLYASPAARAQTLPEGCREIFDGARVTCEYSTTGGERMFEVPPKVTFLIVDLIGAAGGHGCRDVFGHGGDGGAGAEVKGYIILPAHSTPTVLWVRVGGRGHAPATDIRGNCGVIANGGFNGGGENGFSAGGRNGGGSGGGASDIRSSGGSLADRLAVAGGGGGGGGGIYHTFGGAGGSGGATGQTGLQGGTSAEGGFLGGLGGVGATPSSGGAGGGSGATCAGQPGFTGRAGHGGRGAGVIYEVDGQIRVTDSGCGGQGPAPGGLATGGGGSGGGGGGGLYGGGGGGWGDKPTGGTIFKAAGGGGGGGGSSFIATTQGSTITSGVTTPDGDGRVTITYNTPR